MKVVLSALVEYEYDLDEITPEQIEGCKEDFQDKPIGQALDWKISVKLKEV